MRYLMTTCACVLVAACSGGDTNVDADGDGSISREEIAAAADRSDMPKAGRWQVDSEVLEVSLPGMPPEAAGMMNDGFADMFGNYAYCMTQEEAEAGPEALWDDTSGRCEWEQFEMGDGRANSIANCTDPGGGTVRVEMAGTYSDSAYSATNTMTLSMPGGDGKVSVKVEGRHMGACDGSELDFEG